GVMKRIAIVCALLAAAGCDLKLNHQGDRGGYQYCDSTGCYTCDAYGCYPTSGPSCTGNWQCSAGCYCSGSTCQGAGVCRTAADWPSGFVCDSRSTCVPSGGTQCGADGSCPTGDFCDTKSNTCIPSQSCTTSTTCSPGMSCDPSTHYCVPTTCTTDANCPTGTYCNLTSDEC